MIYGVQKSTDCRDDKRELKRFRTLAPALKWRDEIGRGGFGSSFGTDNGHRHIRRLFEYKGRLPVGMELVDTMRRNKTSEPDTARAVFVSTWGEPIKEAADA